MSARENHPSRERRDAAVREKNFSLPSTASRLSRVRWFSRSLYYPTTRSLITEDNTSQMIWCITMNESTSSLGREKFFSLTAAFRLSRVGWFSRALTFRSLYYPWGKIGTTRSLVTEDITSEMIWCISMNESTSSKILGSTLWIPFLNEGFGSSLRKRRISFQSLAPILGKAFLCISSLDRFM